MQSRTKGALKARLREWERVQNGFFTVFEPTPHASDEDNDTDVPAEVLFQHMSQGAKSDQHIQDLAEYFAASSGLDESVSLDAATFAKIDKARHKLEKKLLEARKQESYQRMEQKRAKREDTVRNSSEFLNSKISFLEDMLFLYQTEVDFQVKMRDDDKYAWQLKKDLDDTEDRASALARQLRSAQDELTALHNEKSRAIAGVTADFQRTHERESNRHKQAVQELEHEKAMLHKRIKSLDAELRDSSAMQKAAVVSEVASLQMTVGNLRSELTKLEESVNQERGLRSEAEFRIRELVEQRKEASRVSEVLSNCAREVSLLKQKVSRNHRLVLKELLTIFNTVSPELAGTDSLDGFAGGLGGGGDGNDEYDEQGNLLPDSSGGASNTDEHTVAMAAEVSAEYLQSVLASLSGALDNQHNNLLTNVSKRYRELGSDKAALKVKLTESFHAFEALSKRSRDMARLHAEQREAVGSDRDRILGIKDRVVDQLRMERKYFTSVLAANGIVTTAAPDTGLVGAGIGASGTGAGGTTTAAPITLDHKLTRNADTQTVHQGPLLRPINPGTYQQQNAGAASRGRIVTIQEPSPTDE